MVQRVSAGFFFIPMDPSMERSRENHSIIKKKGQEKAVDIELKCMFYQIVFIHLLIPNYARCQMEFGIL